MRRLFVIFYFSKSQDLLHFFFFFQAEDGIRDPLVTGVQTCALPISAGGIGISHGGARVEVPDVRPGLVSQLEADRSHAVFPLRLLVLEKETLVEASDPVEDVPPRREHGTRQMFDAPAVAPEPEGFASESG